MSLSTTIKTIQDIMRKDAGVDGDAQRVSQLGWMLFLKVLDDRDAEKELLDDDYKSPIPQRLRWRTWAKNPEGITAQIWERCLGCRYCMVACPYDNRVFNWRKPVQVPPADVAVVGETPARPKGVVEKCTFCVQRTTDGLLPRCVIACPTGARTFGDLDDPTSEVSVLLRERPSYVVFPERGTKPSLHYLLKTGPNAEGGAL